MYSIIYTTVGDEMQGKELARELLDCELIACANMMKMRSLYHWEGDLVEDTEFAVLLKTKGSLVDKVVRTIEKIHPYDVPCVLEFEVNKGSSGYLEWIDEQTS